MTDIKIALINRNATAVFVVADSIDAAAAEMSEIGGETIRLNSTTHWSMGQHLGLDYYDAYKVPADLDPVGGPEAIAEERGEFIGHFVAEAA